MEGKTELKPKTGADEIRDLCIRISDKANELSKMAAGKESLQKLFNPAKR